MLNYGVNRGGGSASTVAFRKRPYMLNTQSEEQNIHCSNIQILALTLLHIHTAFCRTLVLFSQKENSRNCVWVAGGLSPCECVC